MKRPFVSVGCGVTMKSAGFWVLLFATAALLCFAGGCDKILYGEQTDFATGYSESKFRQVKQGMAMQDVVSVLGMPLSQSTQEWSEVWSYWPPGKQPSATRSKFGTTTVFSNFFGPATHLGFTPTGTVADVSGNYLSEVLVGLTKEEVRAKVGEPGDRRLSEFQITFHYTAPGKRGSGTYKRREVRFNASNSVSAVIAATYYD